MFRIGQRVVCVPEAPFECASYHTGAIYPVPNRVYTIRMLGPVRPDLLLLAEIDNSHMIDGFIRYEPGFNQKWFRPVVERKTSIEIFTKMLNPNKRERVDSL